MSLELKQVWVRRAATAFRGRYCEVTAFTLPMESETDRMLEFYGEGHLFSRPPGWPNFAFGFYYLSGPMDKIMVEVDGGTFELTPGGGVMKYLGPLPDPCYRLRLDCSMTLVEEGDYRFAVYAGYADLDKNVFYYDDAVERSVKVTVPEVWPWWWPVAVAGGVAGLTAVVGVVAHQEESRHRELLMRLRR